MLHLSQRRSIFEIKRTFIEALQSLWPKVHFWESPENNSPINGQPTEDDSQRTTATIEIATTQHFFGSLSYSYDKSEISSTDHSLIRNAAHMTAIIMANLYQNQQRQHELQAKERQRYENYFKNAFDKVRLYALTYNPEGTILFCNQYFIEKTGWSHAEIIGSNWFELGASEDQKAHLDIAAFKTAIIDHTLPSHYENLIYTKSGEKRYVLWNNVLLYDDQQQVTSITTIGADLTDQKMAEKQLREELNEKTTLIKEIHHRVKNNLNVVTSLLNLQKNEITDIESAKTAFEESQKRIITMALVHEDLYQSENLSEIDICSYVHSLVSRQRELFSAQDNANFKLDIQNLSLNITKAVPIGLIINELLSNACTHAFTEKQEAIISISLRKKDAGMCALRFHDNGCGLPDNFDISSQSSLGLNLINILTQQIDGGLRCFNEEGATFYIEFPNAEESPNAGT
ncbi:MAG: PAS domain S-box protein [Spirochaetaceae bacterium]|nr:PAS domain S-box protein [Spirochaetaceae bacterium]MCF7952184.1 PAS domain S-box protein [Spirochaetaceae bacterium]